MNYSPGWEKKLYRLLTMGWKCKVAPSDCCLNQDRNLYSLQLVHQQHRTTRWLTCSNSFIEVVVLQTSLGEAVLHLQYFRQIHRLPHLQLSQCHLHGCGRLKSRSGRRHWCPLLQLTIAVILLAIIIIVFIISIIFIWIMTVHQQKTRRHLWSDGLHCLSMERPSWWKTILMKDHPDERPPWWKTILMKDHPDERPRWWKTTLMKDHPDERPPWWKTTLMQDHPDARALLF